jgi:hypothetical protein
MTTIRIYEKYNLLNFLTNFCSQKVYFVNTTWTTEHLIRILRIQRAKKIDLSIVQRTNFDGVSLRYIATDYHSQFMDTLELNFRDGTKNLYGNKNHIFENICRCWFISNCEKKTELLFLLLNFISEIPAEERIELIFQKFAVWEEWGKFFASKFDCKLRFEFDLKYLAFPFKPIFLSLFSIICSFLPRKRCRSTVPQSSNSIIVGEEFITNIFDGYPHRSHLFWLPSSGLPSKQICLYFDRADSQYTDSLSPLADERGFLLADFGTDLKITELVQNKKIVEVWMRWFLSSLSAWKSFYCFGIVLLATCWIEKYRSHLTDLQIGLIHQHQEPNYRSIALAMACDLEDVLFVWNHWSIDHFPVPTYRYGFAHLVLSWGEYNTDYFDAQGFSYLELIEVGLISGDNRTPADDSLRLRLREQFASGVDFVVTLFDTSHSFKHISFSTQLIEEFYLDVLDIMHREPTFGLLVKSKGNSLEKIKNSKLKKEMSELMKEGRCVLVKHTRVVPAGLAGDITLSFGVNSAGLICGLNGCEALFYDPGGSLYNFHPLKSVAGFTLSIASTPTELYRSLKLRAEEQRFFPLDPQVKRLLDKFGDGKGAERSGRLLGRFVKSRQEGFGFKESLSHAKADVFESRSYALERRGINGLRVWHNSCRKIRGYNSF